MKPSAHETRSTPFVGDVITTEDLYRGVVLSVNSDHTELNVAGIRSLDDGSETIGFAGTVDVAKVREVDEHWDADRIFTAWVNFFESANIRLPEETKSDFYKELLGQMATQSQIDEINSRIA